MARCALSLAAAADRFVVRAKRVLSVVGVGLVLVAAYQISTDREPPFVSVKVYPAAAKPGESITIRQDVARDMDRECNAVFSDWAFFPGVGRKMIHPPTEVGWEFIAAMERRSPGVLVKTFQIPMEAQPGHGFVSTPIWYWCKPVQYFWKIPVLNETPFTVLPP